MKSLFLYAVLLVMIFTITQSCGKASRLYRYDDKNKMYIGKLSDSTFAALKKYLKNNPSTYLNDTIIIKYDYNNETCWDILDQSEDVHVLGFVKRHKERVQQVLETRKNVSVFNFREPGNSLNKIKKWDQSIIIDSSKQLLNLLFKERCTCGSSVMVMPDKRFIFVRSDSHSEVLDMKRNQIEAILNQ